MTMDSECSGDTNDVDVKSLESQLEELARQHGMPSKSRRKNLLQPRHLEEFSGSTLFDEFARAVCMTNSVMRKELFEAWAMALYVHRSFPTSRRVADLACSHGLVSWALLLLSLSPESRQPPSSSSEMESKSQQEELEEYPKQRRTAVCIDKFMPRAVERLQESMTSQWPDLDGCWDYVEGNLEGTLPSQDTLLVGVHCCGNLSDMVIDLAIHANSPLALVPCCHSRKCLTRDQRIELFGSEKGPNNETKIPEKTLSEYIDNGRIERLRAAGYDVDEARIPIAFTPKNRIILANPRNSAGPTADDESAGRDLSKLNPQLLIASNPGSQKSKKKIARSWEEVTFEIPVGNNPDARAAVKALSGRLASVERRNPPPRTFCFKVAYPSTPFTLEEFKEVLTRLDPSLDYHVEYKYDDSRDHSGEIQRTIRVFCENPQETGNKSNVSDTNGDDPGSKAVIRKRRPVEKEVVRQLHINLCHEIPKVFPGTIVRQTPR